MPLPATLSGFSCSVAAAVLGMVGCGLRLNRGRQFRGGSAWPLGGISIVPRPHCSRLDGGCRFSGGFGACVPFLRNPAAAAKELWVQTEATRCTRGFVCLLLDSSSLVCLLDDMSIGYFCLAAPFPFSFQVQLPPDKRD